MAKVVVMNKGGEFQAQTSAERLETALAELRNQLTEVAGIQTIDKGVEVPKDTFQVDPEVKRKIVAHCKYLQPVFQSDKKLSNTGRDPKADLTILQRVYVDYMRGHRTQNRALAAMNVALEYNKDKPEDKHIDNGYVSRTAKREGWDSLIDVPEPATA